MTLTSTIISNGAVLGTWVGNAEIIEFFEAYGEYSECHEDGIEIMITRETVDTMISEIEDFLYGLVVEDSARWLEPLAVTDAKLVYREELVY